MTGFFGVPYIGRYSKGTPNLYVATGFPKWGMTTAMATAKILTDMIQGRENPYAFLFSPSRSILHRQLLCYSAETAVNFLRPTGPRCPHLGCALNWNEREHSWDCACHGSRFDKMGNLLDDPATGNLEEASEKHIVPQFPKRYNCTAFPGPAGWAILLLCVIKILFSFLIPGAFCEKTSKMRDGSTGPFAFVLGGELHR